MKKNNVFNFGKFFAYAQELQIEYNIKRGYEAPNQTVSGNFYQRVANGSMRVIDAFRKLNKEVDEYKFQAEKLNNHQLNELIKGGDEIIASINFSEMPEKITVSDEIEGLFALGYFSGGRPKNIRD